MTVYLTHHDCQDVTGRISGLKSRIRDGRPLEMDGQPRKSVREVLPFEPR